MTECRGAESALFLLEGEAPLDRVGVVAPPVDHGDSGRAEGDEHDEQLEVESSVHCAREREIGFWVSAARRKSREDRAGWDAQAAPLM